MVSKLDTEIMLALAGAVRHCLLFVTVIYTTNVMYVKKIFNICYDLLICTKSVVIKLANVTNVNIDRIKLLAKSRGFTMKYLCDCLGKHRGFLACVRNGTDRIDEDELAVIADKINTTVAYLTGQTDDPERPSKPPNMPNKNT